MTTDPVRPRILLVDDARDNLAILVEALRHEYRVATANSGAEALALVRLHPPDLILLDVMMPGIDGYEVCAQLKAQALTRDVPVIFVTALTGIQDKTRGFALGAVDYITKPFEPVEVRARVATHLQVVQYRRDLETQNQALRASLARLHHHAHYLVARDHLVHARQSVAAVAAASADIVQVSAEALGVSQAILYRLGRDRPELVVSASLVPVVGPASVALDDPDSPIAGAARQHRPQRGAAGQAAVPMLREDVLLGVFWVEGLAVADVPEDVSLSTLWRLADESALVLYAAQLEQDLEEAGAGFEALLTDLRATAAGPRPAGRLSDRATGPGDRGEFLTYDRRDRAGPSAPATASTATFQAG